jgi:hypothetical protein
MAFVSHITRSGNESPTKRIDLVGAAQRHDCHKGLFLQGVTALFPNLHHRSIEK